MRYLRNLIFLTVVLASMASATVLQTFTDRALWQAATTGRIDIDFESLGLGQGAYQSFSTPTGLTGLSAGLSFVGVEGAGNWLYALNPTFGNPADFGSATMLELEYGAAYHLAVNLPSGTTSFGLDLMSAYPAAGGFRIQVNGADAALVTTLPNPNRVFFGLTTDTAISQVTIYFDGPGWNSSSIGLYDNVSFGAAGTSGGGGGTGGGGEPPPETPEVATMLSVGTGLVMLRWMRRRQTPDAAAQAA